MEHISSEKELAEEKAKFGFNRPATRTSNSENEEKKENIDESEEEEDVEDTSEEEEIDESEDSDDDSESDEDEEDSDEEEDSSSSKKAKIPFKAYNELRKELGDVKRELAKALDNNKALEAKLPDDFQARVDALTKELGVGDPEVLAKIIKFVKEAAVDKNVKTLEDKISKLEEQVKENKTSTVIDEFPSEWKTFEETSFSKEFPNATTEQKKSARELMRRLAGDSKTGGKVYTHSETGQKVLDPYPLDYILFKHREEFKELVTNKTSKGMERARGGKITTSKDDNSADELHVPKNASAETIRDKDKKYRQLEAGASDRFASPVGSI